MENVNLAAAPHAAGQVIFHVIWNTKYKYKMLAKPRFFAACETSIKRAAEKHNIKVIECGAMPNHVHVVIAIPLSMSIASAVQILKGSSSHELFTFEPRQRLRYPRGRYWARGYFARSVGDADLQTIRAYVREGNDPRQRTLTAN